MTPTDPLTQLSTTSPLKILVANWTWYRFGGDWTYIDNLNRLYQEHGHQVIPFSMHSPKNEDAKGFEKYFVKNIDYKEVHKKKNIPNILNAVSKSVYSLEGKRNLEQLLTDHPVDVAHFHNINHYLTPSMLPVLKKRNIPVIWTLHDYTLICPENSFISNGKICENCKGGKFYHCAIQRCKKKSFLASSLAGLENYIHRYLNLFKHVDYFLCPSEFLYKKFLEFNFHPDKLVLTNLCFEIENAPYIKEPGDYVLFVGRLESEKGILTLLKAIDGTGIKLLIAGEGGQKDFIANFIKEKSLDNVSLIGHKTKLEVHDLIKKAQFVVCPSEWYENFPFSVIESLSLSTPVIGAAIGGIPELVIHEQTGFLFEHGNISDLRKNILRLANNFDLQKKLGENAYIHCSSIVNFPRHYTILKEIYERLKLPL